MRPPAIQLPAAECMALQHEYWVVSNSLDQENDLRRNEATGPCAALSIGDMPRAIPIWFRLVD